MIQKKTRYYPVNLDITGRPCLVVGGGPVGARKAATLVDCGAAVTVASPKMCKELVEMEKAGSARLLRQEYDSSLMEGAFLVIGATDDEAINRQISLDANARGVLCNIADRPALCNFVLPAIVRRGDLMLAVSTAGQSPAFAKRLRKELTEKYGPEYADFLEIMGQVRKRLLAEAHAPEEHKDLFEKLIDEGLLEMAKKKDVEAVDRLLTSILGPDYCVGNLCPGLFS
jgi:precorrin-2 dehydrogenase/sirohydrochlorin ferrochelatase